MKQPNILIIYTDDQGTMDAGCYGAADICTPHMDALARRGIRFTQSYAHQVCCPSRAALLTGRYPQRCNVNDWTSNHPSDENNRNMNLDEITIARLLKDNGYRTALFGKWHLGAKLEHGPNAFGFDEFFGHRSGFIDNYRHMFLHSHGGQPPFHDLWEDEVEVHMDGHFFADLVTARATNFLEQNKDNPFFLYVPFNLPHYPYQPDADYMEKYSHLPEPRRPYAAMVSTVDRRIGRIMDKLDELELRENTLVFYMSDNGHSTEDAWNWDFRYGAYGGGGYTGQWRGAKGSFLEGGIRVPAIISMPGTIPEGEVRDQAVSNMDLFPTIVEMCGLKAPERKLDGQSLWPIINDSQAPSSHNQMYFQWQNQWMVREGEWKLLVNGLDTTGKYSEHEEGNRVMETPFLANLDEENPELKNHATAHPEIIGRLEKLYVAWNAEVSP